MPALILKIGTAIAGIASAACSCRAAFLALKGSAPAPPLSDVPVASADDNPQIHIVTAEVDNANLHQAYSEGTHFARNAAIWASIGAALAAISAVFTLI